MAESVIKHNLNSLTISDLNLGTSTAGDRIVIGSFSSVTNGLITSLDQIKSLSLLSAQGANNDYQAILTTDKTNFILYPYRSDSNYKITFSIIY